MSCRSTIAGAEYFATRSAISASLGRSAAAFPAASRQAAAAMIGRATRMEFSLAGLSCEQLSRDVAKRLELERIPARVGQEHRCLFPRLPAESHARLDDEGDAGALEPCGKRLPVGHLEHDAEMRHRHVVAIHRVVRGGVARCARDCVADELVTEEVEVHPVSGAASLGAAEELAVKGAGRGEVLHRDGEVKWSQFRHQAISRASIEMSARSTLLSGQLSFALAAAASNFARSAPGALTVTSRFTRVIANPESSFSSVTVALVSMRSGVTPDSPSRAASAIVKQPACAAPSSSSGLVPGVPSKRVLNEYGVSARTLLSVVSAPLPWRSPPCQTAVALRSMLPPQFFRGPRVVR